MTTTTETVSDRHQLVLKVIGALPGGATDHDIAAALGINVRTANMQRIEFACCQDVGAAVKRTAWRATNG